MRSKLFLVFVWAGSMLLVGTVSATAAITITGANVLDQSLTGQDIKDRSVGISELANGSVQGNQIGDRSIGWADLSGTVRGDISGAYVFGAYAKIAVGPSPP